MKYMISRKTDHASVKLMRLDTYWHIIKHVIIIKHIIIGPCPRLLTPPGTPLKSEDAAWSREPSGILVGHNSRADLEGAHRAPPYFFFQNTFFLLQYCIRRLKIYNIVTKYRIWIIYIVFEIYTEKIFASPLTSNLGSAPAT